MGLVDVEIVRHGTSSHLTIWIEEDRNRSSFGHQHRRLALTIAIAGFIFHAVYEHEDLLLISSLRARNHFGSGAYKVSCANDLVSS